MFFLLGFVSLFPAFFRFLYLTLVSFLLRVDSDATPSHMRERTPTRERVHLFRVGLVSLSLPAFLLVCLCRFPRVLLYIFPCFFFSFLLLLIHGV